MEQLDIGPEDWHGGAEQRERAYSGDPVDRGRSSGSGSGCGGDGDGDGDSDGDIDTMSPTRVDSFLLPPFSSIHLFCPPLTDDADANYLPIISNDNVP